MAQALTSLSDAARVPCTGIARRAHHAMACTECATLDAPCFRMHMEPLCVPALWGFDHLQACVCSLVLSHSPHEQVKPFIKCCNYNHLMPTRYTLDVDFKSVVTADIVGSSNLTARQSCRKEVCSLIPLIAPSSRRSHRCSSCRLLGRSRATISCTGEKSVGGKVLFVTEDGEEQVVFPEAAFLSIRDIAA